MAYEKILILESSWATNDGNYIKDSRSTSEIYSSFQSILSVQEIPVFAITRPLLAMRFRDDIFQFVSLPSNERGPNFVILSAHGYHTFSDKRKHRRVLGAIDGEINISFEIIHLVKNHENPLKRTIFILDSCTVGEGIRAFLRASGALGVIGFSEAAEWIDSSVFILALLLKFQQEGVFQMKRVSPTRPNQVLQQMKQGVYQSLVNSLGVEDAFRSN